MSALAQSMLRIITFGAVSRTWGAAWEGAERQLLLGGARSDASLREFTIDAGSADDDWHLSGDGLSLTIAPVGEAAPHAELGGFDQLCRVSGEAMVDGGTDRLDELGRRCAREAPLLEEFESIRDFSAWFEPASGAALTALRPAGASGHDADLIGATLFDEGGATLVAEPRLSTTYSADGAPSGVGLELWIAEHENQEELLPRRLAGQGAASVVSSTVGALQLQARPFRCVSQGQEGDGVYLLANSR
jgi:hypothetical protein